MIFKGRAKVKIHPHGVRAIIEDDLSRYYKWLFEKATYNLYSMNTGRYGPHITIVHTNFHVFRVSPEFKRFWGNRKIVFTYNPENIRQGGQSKGFIGFYLDVECPKAIQIRRELKVLDKARDGKLHISLFTNKHLKNNARSQN